MTMTNGGLKHSNRVSFDGFDGAYCTEFWAVRQWDANFPFGKIRYVDFASCQDDTKQGIILTRSSTKRLRRVEGQVIVREAGADKWRNAKSTNGGMDNLQSAE